MADHELKAWKLFCYCFLFVVGILGNLTVILVVLRSGSRAHRLRQVPFNVYLMSLAIVDLATAVVCLPVYVMTTSSFPHPTGTKGTIFCKAVTGWVLPFWFGGVSVYLLVIISFERYNAICKPFVAATQRTSLKTAIYITSAWCIGLIIQLPTIVGVEYISTNGTNGPYCHYPQSTTGTSVYACAFTLQYAVPAVIFIVNFYRTQKCVRKLDRNLKLTQSAVNEHQLASAMKGKRRTVRIVFVVSAAFFICWTPDNILYFLFQYGGDVDDSWKYEIYHAARILGLLNSCINPFLYAFQSREFRSHCKKVLKQIFGVQNCGRHSDLVVVKVHPHPTSPRQNLDN